jgi:hypothetical protein
MKMDSSLKNKSIEIQQTIANLQDVLGKDAFEVADHWEADLCSIGIAHPKNNQLLVYVSTCEQAKDEFFVATELPPENVAEIYQPGSEFKNVKFDGLIEIIRRHFSFAQL